MLLTASFSKRSTIIETFICWNGVIEFKTVGAIHCEEKQKLNKMVLYKSEQLEDSFLK